jgi:hypothetical protein
MNFLPDASTYSYKNQYRSTIRRVSCAAMISVNRKSLRPCFHAQGRRPRKEKSRGEKDFSAGEARRGSGDMSPALSKNAKPAE